MEGLAWQHDGRATLLTGGKVAEALGAQAAAHYSVALTLCQWLEVILQEGKSQESGVSVVWALA